MAQKQVVCCPGIYKLITINENVIRANRSNLLIGQANYQTINDLKVRRAF